ncbi:MAG: group 1 truncated hemoglobin [Pseudomonadota bacterium]
MQPTDPPASSLYAQLGGAAALNAFVGALYFNLLNSPQLSPFFADADVERVMRHQRALLAVLLTGDDGYDATALAAVHRPLIEQQGLRERHFDILLGIVELTLDDLDVAPPLADAIAERFAATRAVIFRPPPEK